MPEYYIIPDINRRKSQEIYSIDKVISVSEDRSNEFAYIPISAHEILETSDPDYNYKRFFTIVRKPIKADMAETYIR